MQRLHQIRTELTRPGQRFEIESVEIEGVSTRVWKHAPETLRAVLEQSKAFGDRDYLVYENERLSYARHFARVSALSHTLMARFGIGKGDRVAIAMRNYPEFATVFWAAVALGAIVVPLNAWWTGKELEFALRDSGASILFADHARLTSLAVHLPRLSLKAVIGVRSEHEWALSFEEVIESAGPVQALPEVDLATDDPATLLYTSGTTGRPKGALGTHRNASSCIWNTLFCLASQAATHPELQPSPESRKAALIVTPLFHVIGCLSGLVMQTFAGATIVLMHKWEPHQALDLIERERITSTTMVPSTLWQMVEAQGERARDLSSMQRVGYGGAPAPPELYTNLARIFPGVMVMTGYGMTETSSPATHGFADYLARAPATAGLPPPVCEVRIVDEEGQPVADGETGELWIRGPNVVRGYWQRPDANAETFIDGWVKTGDIGRVDEHGNVFIVDRVKDMIIRGGENIYCVEVENAIIAFGKITQAAVFGLPHPRLGEVVAAVVLTERGAKLEEDALRRHLSARLAAFKIPVRFEFREGTLPRNATGKVLKAVLRDELLAASDTPS